MKDFGPVHHLDSTIDWLTLVPSRTRRREIHDSSARTISGPRTDQASQVVAHTLACAVQHASYPILDDPLRTIDELGTAPFTITRSATEHPQVVADTGLEDLVRRVHRNRHFAHFPAPLSMPRWASALPTVCPWRPVVTGPTCLAFDA